MAAVAHDTSIVTYHHIGNCIPASLYHLYSFFPFYSAFVTQHFQLDYLSVPICFSTTSIMVVTPCGHHHLIFTYIQPAYHLPLWWHLPALLSVPLCQPVGPTLPVVSPSYIPTCCHSAAVQPHLRFCSSYTAPYALLHCAHCHSLYRHIPYARDIHLNNVFISYCI
jgi:hypothetical protein